MVQRNYQAPQFQVQDRRVVQEQRVGQADTRPNYERSVGDEQWRDRLLTNLGANASNALNKMADIEFSNLYLEGQAAVGVVQSEEELQGNPLTRDWKVAGYRDTMGKLALADQQASFQQDLVQLREKNPEDLQAYLAERRQKFMPALAGMSREARAAAAGQMLLQDRDATKRWTSEHTKFIIDQKSQAVHTQWNVAMRGMADAQLQAATGQVDPKDFTETLRATAGTVVSSVWMDNSLPHEVKRQLTFEMAQAALSNDSIALYDYLSNNPIPDAKGRQSTLISRLDGEQQLKLANSYRDAYQRTNDSRSLFRMEQVANLEAQLDANTYQGTYDELKGLLNPMVLNKTITGERRMGLINKYLDKQYKLETTSTLWDAGLRGDVQYAYSIGKGPEDIVKAGEQVMARRGMNSEQQMQAWLKLGRNGLQEGYKKVGEYLGASLRQMVDSKDGTVLPQHAAIFRSVNASIRQAEEEGLMNTRVNVLSGLGEQDRMFAEQIFRRVDTGASLDEAVQEAKKVQADDAGLSGSARAARAAVASKDVATAVAAIEPRGFWETGWDKVKAAFGSQSAAFNLTATPYSGFNARDNFFRDSPTVQFYTEQTRMAVQQEADNVLLLRPSATADQVLTVAKANVAARTISTNQGPLILPRNVNMQAVFGVAPGNQAAIGNAIDGMLTSTAENTRWQLLFSQGRLFAQEYDKDGQRVGTGMFITPEQIKARVAEDTAKATKAADERFGNGKVVEADGVKVQYNGTNTAGVQNDWMLGFRDNLVKHEGVRGSVYKDTTGRDTVGVGVASHNPAYPKPGADGKVTAEQVSNSFRDASDSAAQAGAKIARRVDVDNKAGFMLMSELAYQSGNNFLFQKNTTGDEYRAFVRAIRNGDVNEATVALQSTAAYRASGDARKKHYETLLNQAMYSPLRASGTVQQ